MTKIENQSADIEQLVIKLNEVELNVQSQLQQYSRTSEVERGLDKFENVASRTSDVRQDLQAQVDDLVQQVKNREPVIDEKLYAEVQAISSELKETRSKLSEMSIV